MKLAFPVRAEKRRLRFTGETWKEIPICVHGIKLRWHCPECAAYFKARDPKKPWRGD